MSLSLVAILFILYAIWDVNYFLRCVFTLGYAHFFQKKRKVTEKTSIYGNYSTARFDELLVILLDRQAFVQHKMLISSFAT